jgi:mRNA export factor
MFGAQAQQPLPTPDIQVPSPPSDSVTSLNFTPAPNANYLLSTSWSGQVQVWDTFVQVGANNQPSQMAAQPKLQTTHDLPLDGAWLPDGSKVVTCGCDRQVKLWDLQSNQQTTLGSHDAPVRKVAALDPAYGGIIVSGADTALRHVRVAHELL